MKKQKYEEQEACDRYDYLAAAFCGGMAGLIDILFVGAPGKSALGTFSDQAADAAVKKFASLTGWRPRSGKEDSVASAIGFLERNFSVNYDQRYSADVGNGFFMSTKNHHFKSLSHAPDPVGLFFSILDQFMHTASFVDHGQLIRIDTSDQESPLKGGNVLAKIFCGFCNWLGHIASDVAGSSGGRGNGLRGTGVPVPFMELFQFCDFGSLQVDKDRQTLAVVMTRVFQEGYDARFAGAMAVPVLLEELLIRAFWVFRRHYQKGYAWKECLPSTKHADLRLMLLVGNSVLCFFDLADATVRSGFGTNMVVFFLHLNIVAWARLILLVLKELAIRLGPKVCKALEQFWQELLTSVKTEGERRQLEAFYARMAAFDRNLDAMYRAYVAEIEQEYEACHQEIAAALTGPQDQRLAHSVALARRKGVQENKIIHSVEELDKLLGK